ncbi:MAG TPA: hypothetical protein VNJ29_01605 [Candidatus Nitrosotenuis sp.]|nr:hypothetical protein [Candidatus Nitrosotenuis sp.]
MKMKNQAHRSIFNKILIDPTSFKNTPYRHHDERKALRSDPEIHGLLRLLRRLAMTILE